MKKTEEYKYECINCNFKTRDKKDYNRHLKTKKHTKHILGIILECSCGKIYKYKKSLTRHQQSCNINSKNYVETDTPKESEIEIIVNHLIEQKELVNKLYNKLEEQSSKLEAQSSKLEEQNNKIEELKKLKPAPITNNTNILLVLNERFSDAMSLNEFINNMIIKCDHLLYTGKKGIDKGIVNILMDNMKDLKKCKRPICSNKDNLFIKGDEEWLKDQDQTEIKKATRKIQYKQIKNINLYQKEKPNWNNAEHTQLEYTTMLSKVMADVDNNRIIREIKKNKSALDIVN
jgi:uncharacterized C2H2 Zn-finger protein